MKLLQLTSALLATSWLSIAIATKMAQSPAPTLAFLFTIDLHTGTPINVGASPLVNQRLSVPVTGGTFKGPKLNGTVLAGGSDQAIIDKEGKFHVNSRFNLRTSDGADIYVRASGVQQPEGYAYGSIVLETGHEDYYWLNHAFLVDVSRAVENSTSIYIDVYQVSVSLCWCEMVCTY
jgi:hypothetical protein